MELYLFACVSFHDYIILLFCIEQFYYELISIIYYLLLIYMV